MRRIKMKNLFVLLVIIVLVFGCSNNKNKEEIKNEVLQAEKDFALMTKEKGITEAFYFFADENAVIKRGNDSLIFGKENIKDYYQKKNYKNTVVTWSPDFIEVSNYGDLAYTYGKFTWKVKTEKGDTAKYNGVFHTVWKKQKDNSWKYVWD